ncbi:MAG: hypothetical protein AB7S49_12430 [Arcobacter sp.]
MFEYIEVFYTRERSHNANNNLSPVEFEEKQKLIQKEGRNFIVNLIK